MSAPRVDRSHTPRTAWPWIVFGLLLCFSVHLQLAESQSAWVGPVCALPFLTAWVAHVRGWQVVWLLLALTIQTAFGLHWQLADAISAFYGVTFDTYLLAVGSALVFVQPSPFEWPRHLFQPWWRWSLLVAAVVLWSISTFGWQVTLLESDEAWIVVNAVPALLAVAPATLRWRETLAYARERGFGSLPLLAALGVFAVLMLGVLLSIYADEYTAYFGNGAEAAGLILTAGAFLAAASGLFDWRWLAGLFVVLLATENLFFAFASSDDFFPHLELVAAISAVLLGAALSPFWRTRGAVAISLQRASGFLLGLLALQACAAPGWYDPTIFGGIAFLGGLVWRFRGLAALPVLLELVHAIPILASGEEFYSTEALPVELAAVGFNAFVFAFFGLLANRFSTSEEPLAPAPRLREVTT